MTELNWFYKPYATVLLALKARKELLTMTKQRDLHEDEILAQYNKLIIDGLCDAERTRTAELLYDRNWRDDLTIEDALDMAAHIERVRNK